MGTSDAIRAIERSFAFFREGGGPPYPDGMNEREISLAGTEGLAALQNALGTEQTMHNAWRKRANEAEAQIADRDREIQKLRERAAELEPVITKQLSLLGKQSKQIAKLREACEAARKRLYDLHGGQAELVMSDDAIRLLDRALAPEASTINAYNCEIMKPEASGEERT